MITLQGKGVSSGIASGRIHFLKRDNLQAERKPVEDTEAELARFRNAIKEAKRQLEELARTAQEQAGQSAAALFETHSLMLEDLDFVDAAESLIGDDKINAEAAVSEAGRRFADMFAAMDDPYMKERSADVEDITKRLVDVLSGKESDNGELGGVEKGVIIAADDLSPSETVSLDKSRIMGFLLSGGSANGHTAILARTLGIPAVTGIGDSLYKELEGRFVMLDGSIGYAVVDPDIATRDYLEKKQKDEFAVNNMLEKLKGMSDITADGKEIKVYANITSAEDVDAVIKNDAAGIGLFRSEFLYLGRNDFPSEEEQLEAYKSVLLRMNGKRVIIRTLDIGADKAAGYFGLAADVNPALGMRGLRICLTRPEIFKTQLRALYRASAYGKMSVMFPMVASLWEVQEAKRMCATVRRELKSECIPFDEETEIGIMIETPAAVMTAAELAREVSFFSIGTNDLAQYTLAVDRQGGQGIERFYDAHHPAVLKMVEQTIKAAHAEGIWAGICGEIASDLSLTEAFIKMGADELSVSPGYILPLRNAVRNSTT